MKITLIIAIVSYAISSASAQERGAEFGAPSTSRILEEDTADDAETPTSSSSSSQKGIFSKVGKGSKSGKSKSSKKKGKSSDDNKSQQPFDKSGKNKSYKESTAVNNTNNEAPHKLFNKSQKKGKSSKNAKKGNSGKGGKSKSHGGHLFPKSGKNKSSGGYDADDGSGEHVPWEEDEVSIESTDDGVDDTVTTSSNASPTPQPICNSNTVRDDFNLCIAIDASGSVCSGYSLDCTNCSPAIFCQDAGYDRDTCCANYAKVLEFSSGVVTTLEELDVQKSFSIVQFSTDANVESELSSGSETLPVLDGMKYSGGWTNHAAAIQACQQTLDVSDNRRDYILLITDGVSTAPRYSSNPEGVAEETAELAKEDGISIIPIFISAQYDADALAFMSRLSSGREVFDVTGFESLDSLQESLVNQVSCTTIDTNG